MKTYLIAPAHRTISEIHYSGNYEEIYKLLDISTFDAVRLYDNEVAYIDDDGLYNNDHHFWIHRNYPTPIAGPALLLGTDQEGNDIAPSTSIDELRSDVKWVGDKHDVTVLVRFNPGMEDYRPHYFTE